MLAFLRKNCRPVVVATIVVALILVQAFFVARLLYSTTPREDASRQNSAPLAQELSIKRRGESNPTIKKVDSLLLGTKRDSAKSPVDRKVLSNVIEVPPVVEAKQDKDSVVDAKEQLAPNSLTKEGAPKGLPQERAALSHHHSKRQHLEKPFNNPAAYSFVPEVLVETDETLTPRPLTERERAGNNILFTLRTTVKFHKMRLPILFDTWLTKVNTSNVFLVTDGEDKDLEGRAGTKYINVPCRASYNRDDLCCKAGTELSLMFREDNLHYDWLCHVDDDIYVIMEPLVEQLSKFRPREEPVYFGRSGSAWNTPRKVIFGAKYGKPGQLYHFAVGGMYCLSRAMLELARPYLVGGQEFASSCKKTLEPEDVTVGVVVGVMLNQSLSRTEMIYTHGLGLDFETMKIQDKIDKQIAYAYGYGAVNWRGPGTTNCIIVPHALFSYKEDNTQFYSLHCFLYPSLVECVEQASKKTQSRKTSRH